MWWSGVRQIVGLVNQEDVEQEGFKVEREGKDGGLRQVERGYNRGVILDVYFCLLQIMYLLKEKHRRLYLSWFAKMMSAGSAAASSTISLFLPE